jgi:hypothetical protein
MSKQRNGTPGKKPRAGLAAFHAAVAAARLPSPKRSASVGQASIGAANARKDFWRESERYIAECPVCDTLTESLSPATFWPTECLIGRA